MKKQPDEQLPQNTAVPEDIVVGTKNGDAAVPGQDVEEIHLVGERTPVEHDDTTIYDDYTDYKFTKPGSRSRSRSRSRSHAHHSGSSSYSPKPEAQAVSKQQAVQPEVQAASKQQAVQPEAQAASKQQAVKPEVQSASKQQAVQPEAQAASKQRAVQSEAQAASKQQAVQPEAQAASKQRAVQPEAQAASMQQAVQPEAQVVTNEQAVQPEVQAVTNEQAVNSEVQSASDGQIEDLDTLVVFSQRSSSRHHHHHSSGSSSGHSHHHHSSGSSSGHSHHHHSSGSSDGQSHHHHHHHHHRRRRKKMKTWKKVILIVISSILALTLALGGVFLYMRNKGHDELFDAELKVMVPDTMQAEVQDDGDYIVYKGRTYKYNEDITSMMFIGIDKDFEEENEQGTGGQADVLVLMAVDTKSHKMSMLAIPRDTFTDVALYSPSGHYSGMKNMQVCMAYAYGDGKETSCENTISSVRRLFYNIPIKTYYALDLSGIAAVNDSVGGVDVVSPETIEMFTEGESYHLEGKNAEHFVRLRNKERVDSSLLRLERQKVYTRGFISTMMDSLKKDITSAVRVFNESAPYSVTNLTASKVSYLATELVTGGSKLDTEMKTIPGKMKLDEGLARYDIDENAFFEQFLSVFYQPMF